MSKKRKRRRRRKKRNRCRDFKLLRIFRNIQQGSWWWLGELCEVPKCLLWRGLRCHCPVYNIFLYLLQWMPLFFIEHGWILSGQKSSYSCTLLYGNFFEGRSLHLHTCLSQSDLQPDLISAWISPIKISRVQHRSANVQTNKKK